MLTSLLKTLAGKHDSTVTKIARKYAATIQTPHGPRTCMQAVVDRGEGKQPSVATFGGIPLRRQRTAILTDRVPVRATSRRKALIHRLLAGQCEICGEPEKVRVHQIRKLADLDKRGQPQPEWAQIMAGRRRKTPVGLRTVLRQHPPQEGPRVIHGTVAGEPGELKGSCRGSGGGQRKRSIIATAPLAYLVDQELRAAPPRSCAEPGGVAVAPPATIVPAGCGAGFVRRSRTRSSALGARRACCLARVASSDAAACDRPAQCVTAGRPGCRPSVGLTGSREDSRVVWGRASRRSSRRLSLLARNNPNRAGSAHAGHDFGVRRLAVRCGRLRPASTGGVGPSRIGCVRSLSGVAPTRKPVCVAAHVSLPAMVGYDL